MRNHRRGTGGTTIQDVAHAAGVSAMTVSRVVNGQGNVRDATRLAVEAAVARLNYRPNSAARSLAAGAATQIGLLYGNPSASYLSRFLIGALTGARAAGSHLVVEPCDGDSAADHLAAIRALADAEVRGVILPPPLSEILAIRNALDDSGIAWVAVACGPVGDAGQSVGIDDHAAAEAMTRHLIDLGHRDIAFICGHPNQSSSRARHDGWIAGLTAAGLDPASMRVERGDFSFASGVAAAERLLAAAIRPSAIFASNDDMAAAAIGVAHRLGLDVPGDVSIAGFDDTAAATNVWPALTTIRQPIADMAEAAVAMLVAHLRGRGRADEPRALPFELVVRDSCAGVER